MSDKEAVKRVLRAYLQRLSDAVSRTPLLDATPSVLGRGTRVDLTHFNCFGRGTAERIVDRVLQSRACKVHPPRALSQDEDEDDAVEEKRIRVYRQVERHLIRTADKIERDTGNRSLWLAYPLLYLTVPSAPDRGILAPIFLWPVRVALDSSRQMGVEIAADRQADCASINKIMRAWIKSKRGLELDDVDAPVSRSYMQATLSELLVGLGVREIADASGEIGPSPRRSDLAPARSPCIFNSGFIGVMRWHNQSLMDDLEDLLQLDDFDDVLGTFATGYPAAPLPEVTYASELDRHHVTDADYSQEQAVIEARRGPGLVIHGPPGTGKSQTITNLIADALARHETVLVVCQKRAAVDVVANNLKQVGLYDLCTVVHDAVSDRKPVIESLRQQLETSRGGLPSARRAETERTRLARSIEHLESKLNDVHRELAHQRACGLTYREIMARLIKAAHAYPGVKADKEEIGRLVATFDDERLTRTKVLIERVGALFQSCRPLEHPWRHRGSGFELTPQTRQEVQEALSLCNDASTRHDAFIMERGIGLPLDPPPVEFVQRGSEALRAVQAVIVGPGFQSIPELYRHVQQDPQIRDAYRELVELIEGLPTKPLDERVDHLYPQQSEEEEARVRTQLEAVLEHRGKFLFFLRPQYRALRRSLRFTLLQHGIAWSWDQLTALKATLEGRRCRRRIDQCLTHFAAFGLGAVHSDASRTEAIKTLTQWLKLCVAVKNHVSVFPQLTAVLEALQRADAHAIVTWRNQLQVAIERCEAAQALREVITLLKKWLTDEPVMTLLDRVERGQSIHAQIDSLGASFETIDQLMEYEREFEGLQDEERALIESLTKRVHGVPSNDSSLTDYWQAALEVSALTAWRQDAVQQCPLLQSLSEQRLKSLRFDLRSALDSKRRIEASAIEERWRELGSAVDRTDWKGLLALTGRNAKRLRQIVHRGYKLGLFQLRPCWLTNPETASQILPLEEGLFDLVIFDEASQLPLEQAMPAIFRGSRIVVAGDEHQLPPTSFFQTVGADGVSETGAEVESDDEDANAITVAAAVRRDGVALSLDSTDLLDLSKNILAERMLNVHYRSRHPALIQFSNHAFYRGRLEAAHPVWGIPSAEAAPIVYHPVQGIYEKRTNRTEAKHVVNLLRHLWSEMSSPPTIGVVTFNKDQEELIEEEVGATAATEHQFRAFLERERDRKDGQKDVGFFVKNLESVQGDERDLIIFSTTFGPSEPGQLESFKRSFGPLTQRGGERRLNVAVTRARDCVVVVSSMPLERISDISADLPPGNAVKARDYLQAYMKYAEAVSLADEASANRWLRCVAKLSGRESPTSASGVSPEFESEFEEQVYARLVSAGWSVDTQVGQNGFRIDLAVRHPDPDKGYLLGIECDGETYHRSLSARARDIWREDILKSYGWELFRIWSPEWWVFPDRVLAQLNEALKARLAESLFRPRSPARSILSLTKSAPVPSPTQPASTLSKAVPRVELQHDARALDEDHEPALDTRASKRSLLPIEPPAQLPMPATFGAQPQQWAGRFATLLCGSDVQIGAIAEWVDEQKQSFELLVERHRARPMLVVKCLGEEFGHYSVRGADPAILQSASRRLATVECHSDVLDWFRWLQRELHPEIWSSGSRDR